MTFLIVAIGLLGLGALQVNPNNSFETYQRAGGEHCRGHGGPHPMTNAAVAGEYSVDMSSVADSGCGGVGSQRDLCEW